MYCKGKWCTADGKDPLFGRVDGFQIGPNISTRFPAWEAGFSGLFNVYYISTRIIGKYFSKPIDKIGIWVYYLAIESELTKRKERIAMFVNKSHCCCRMRISRAYPYGGVHSYTLCCT